MNHMPPVSLSALESCLLFAAGKLVPRNEREDWSRTWHAELWHAHHRNHNGRSFTVATDLYVGLTRDALWLRTDKWRRTFSGTPILCITSVLGLCLFSTLISLAFNGSWHSLSLYLSDQFKRSLLEAPLVVFVAFATASHRHIEYGSTSGGIYWIKRQIFFIVKILHVLSLAFLLSAEACQPVHLLFPNVANLLQIFYFVLFALVALRWAIRDQDRRCKQCLHLLAKPSRVGRPSHNLLEWNGTELICKQGHGLLSIPEIETSWCRSSQWVDREFDLVQAASI